jgi:GNAT superfamily N-acetyltransferase
MNVTITKLKLDEISLVSKIVRNTIKDSWKGIFSQDILEEFYEQYSPLNLKKDLANGAEYFGAVNRGKLIAVGCLRNDHLPILFVEYNFQRRGVGTKLYLAIEKIAQDRNVDNFVLEAVPEVDSFYKRFGFHEVEKVRKKKAGKEYFNTLMTKSFSHS